MEANEHGGNHNNTLDPSLRERAMNALEEIFFVFTPDGKILEWNQRVNEETGYSDEEIATMHPAEFMPGSETQLLQQQIETVLEEGRTRFESYFQTKTGRQIPYEFTGSLLQQRNRTLICGTGRNITERKRTEEDLEASEKRYRRLFEDALEGIAITTPKGEIVDANPAAAEMLGYSPTELRTMNTAELYVHSGERKKVAALLQRQDVIREREVRLRRANGEELVCEFSATVQRGENDEPILYRSFFRDVTERKQAQRALEESERLFRTLAERSLIGIALVREGEYLYVNPAFAQIVGRTPDELIGESPAKVFHPDDLPAVRRRVKERLREDREEAHYKARVQTKEGETRHVEVFGSRIEYQGEPAIIGTMQDITEQRHMQQEMLRVQEEERKRIGQDLHDTVASQLTGATMMMGALLSQAENDEVAERIEEIRKVVNESADDVRQLSRGLNPGGLSDGELLPALRGLVQSADNACLEENVEQPLLEDEEATHLYRIAQEAVTNARRHAAADEIVIRVEHHEGSFILEIEDDGKGFDPPNAHRSTAQTGLGLRSMQHRADLLDAELSIDSAPGEGTHIRCQLPT